MRRILIIILILLIIAGGAALLWWFYTGEGGFPGFGPKEEEGSGLPQAGNIPQDGENAPQLGGVSKNDPGFEDEVIKHDLENRSKAFIERLASYSSDSNLANMSDLYPEMTEELKTAVAGKRLSLLSRFETGGFVGYTTNVVTTNVTAFDKPGGTATVTMTTQREVTTGGASEPERMYVEYSLAWERSESGRWFVSSISGEY